MATISISQLDTATQAKVDDLYEVAVVDENSQTGYASRKLTAAQIATLIAQGVQFSGLSTEAKTIIAAINEASENGGTEVEPNPTGTPTDTLQKIGIDGTIYEVGASQPVSKTVTGNPINITDAADAPIVSGTVVFEPIQDLHGYDKPWAGGAGKNKLPLILGTLKTLNTDGIWNENVYTLNGGTFTVNTDAGDNVTSIKTNGTFNTNTVFNLISDVKDVLEVGTDIIINGCPLGGGATRYVLMANNIGNDSGDGVSGAVPSIVSKVAILIYASYNVDNLLFYPMIRLATETDPTFEPYSNICPITGYTECEVEVRGKNLLDESTLISGQRVNDNGTIGSSSNQSLGYIECTEGQTYTVSALKGSTAPETRTLRLAVAFYSDIYDVGQLLSTQNIANTSYGSRILTATAPTGAKYMYFSYTTLSLEKQLEVGSEATSYEPYKSKVTYTIDLNGTRYGREVSVSGKMLVDRASVKVSDLTWRLRTESNNVFYADISNKKNATSSTVVDNILCSEYEVTTGNAVVTEIKDFAIGSSTSGGRVFIRDSRFNDTSDFTAAMSDTQIVYELANPLTVQLTLEQIRMLEGTNIISTNMNTMSLEYITQDYQPLVELIERSAGHHYSEQERVVGTYFGKTLYEKTYEWNETLSGQFYKEIALGNPDIVFIRDGWYMTSAGEYAPIPYTHPTSTYSIGVYINSAKNQLEVRCGSAMTLTVLSVTFRYTKTTD